MVFPRCQNSPKATAVALKARTSGVVLLVTLVVLVVLASLGYNLASRVAAQRHRDNYIIDYARACYARDSALKYALASLQDFNDVELIDRPNEPDFSDLFAMDEADYQQLLREYAEQLSISQSESAGETDDQLSSLLAETEKLDSEIGKLIDINELRDSNTPGSEPNILETVTIPGPYGPPWPFVTQPAEFEIGSAKVKIEIEDENAKFPVGWGMLADKKVEREAEASFDTFCEWMGVAPENIGSVKYQLKQVASKRPFKVDFEPIRKRERVTSRAPSTSRRRGRRQTRTTYKTTIVPPSEQIIKQARDVSQLMHSSLVDAELLAQPSIVSEYRKESALKYMGLWGATKVNINSAPRQVLEAAFTFGGDAESIADEVIKKRKEKPFEDIEQLKRELFRYSTAIERCEPYITTSSDVFTIRVTAVSGVARASGIIVIYRQASKAERIAMISG